MPHDNSGISLLVTVLLWQKNKITYRRLFWAYGSRGKESIIARRHISKHRRGSMIRKWRGTSSNTSRNQRERTGGGLRLWTPKSCPQWYTSSIKSISPKPPQMPYHLGNKCSNAWIYGGDFSFKPSQLLLYKCMIIVTFLW